MGPGVPADTGVRLIIPHVQLYRYFAHITVHESALVCDCNLHLDMKPSCLNCLSPKIASEDLCVACF